MASHSHGVWGIDVGLCALKAIRLEFVDGETRATAFDYIEHPKILSQPDADPDQLTREALEQFLSRNSLKGDMVVISVAGQSGLARFVKLPPVEERKIADIVKFEAKQQIPFPLDEVVWDYQKIGTPMVTDGFAMETEIGLFAMKKDMVNRALQQFKDVGVEVHIVQMAPLALINYLAYDSLGLDPKKPGEEPEENHDCVVALDIGTDNSNLVITDGNKVIWQRPIPLGGNHFTRALTKDMKLTFAKAEHLKRNAVKSPDLRKILASLKSVLSDFVGEVQRSLGYFTNTHRDATIKYMVGLGGAFRLPGLQKFLQEKLQLEVRKVSKFERLKGEDVIVSPQFNENILSFAVPYGLALQGLKRATLQTNLLPYDIRVERMVRGKKPWAAAAAAALLVAVAGLAFGKNLEKSAVNNPEIDAADREFKSLKSEVDKRAQDFKGAEEQYAKSVESLRRLVAGVDERFNWQLLAQYINLSLPQPDGNRLVAKSSLNVPVHSRYFTADAQTAFDLLQAQRAPSKSDKQKNDPAQNMKNDEFIKKYLIQVNIEGIHPLYCDDVPAFFKSVGKDHRLISMPDDEKQIVKAAATKPVSELSEDIKKRLPEKAWIVEVRGYTYHQEGEVFIMNTIVENLRYPEMVNGRDIFKSAYARRKGNNNVPMDAREKLFKEQVLDQVSFLFLYKSEKVENPEPGNFALIKGSELPKLLKGAPAAPAAAPPADGVAVEEKKPKISRDGWRPFAETAGAAHGGAGGGGPGGVQGKLLKDKGPVVEKQARYEFILLFLWKEPIRSTEAAADAKKD